MRSISGKYREPKKASSKLVTLAILLVAAVGLAGGYLWYKAIKPANNNVSPSDTAGNNGTVKEDLPSGDTSTPTDPNNVPAQAGTTVEITQLEQTGGSVVVSGLITGGTGGKCVAEFKSPDQIQPLYGEVATTKDGDKTICGPIKIDELRFSAIGEWTVVLTFYTDGNASKAESQSKTITIK